jgi:hypothetical protein
MNKTILSLIVTSAFAIAGITAIDGVYKMVDARFAGKHHAGGGQNTAKPSSKAKPVSRRKFRMKLTLREPGDLKIREGDTIKAGQVMADRVSERTRLEVEKAKVEANIAQLDHPILKPVPIKVVAAPKPLPDPTYSTQEAEIDFQRLKMSEAEHSRVSQLRKVEALKGIDGLPAEVFDHEIERTRETDQKYDVANAELRKSESALEKAKYEQENAAYSHQLELSKYEVSVQQNELERSNQLQRQDDAVRDRAYKIATLRQQIITIDNQIAQLANIKSPYDAKVQRVKFVEQNNQDLIVDVVLAIDAADRQFPRSKDPSAQGRNTQGNQGAKTTAGGDGDFTTTTDATDSGTGTDATDQP